MTHGVTDDGSDYRARTVLLADYFMNIVEMGTEEAVRAVRASDMHILMDMQSYTRGELNAACVWQCRP